MALDRCLKDLFRQRIWIARITGVTEFGDPQYGPPCPAFAFVERERNVIATPQGEERQTDHVVFTDEAVTEDDRLWLPWDDHTDEARGRLPQRIFEGIDEDGTVHHREVFV